MANIVYSLVFILSLVNIVLLSAVVKRQRCFYYVIFFMLICISCFGYVTIANATNIAVALQGNVLTYMGACFLPYCFFLCISELCQIPIKKRISLLMLAYNIMVFCLVWLTIKGEGLYYSDIQLVYREGIAILVTEPGPLRILYEISIVFYAFASIIVMILAFRSKKNLSYKNLAMLISLELNTMVIYAIEKMANHTIDWVCIAYILDEFIFLILIYRIGKYDVSESIAGSVNSLEDYAYMIFDMKLNYLGCSPMLKKFFPEVNHVRVDKPIEPRGNKVIEKSVEWLTTCSITGAKDPLYIVQNGRELKCTWRAINNGVFGIQSGYLVEIFDDTEQRKYMRLLSNYNEHLEDEVEEKLEYIQAMQDQIIIGISDIVESRDNNTGGHIKRSSETVRIFIERLAEESPLVPLSKRYCENVIKAAPMHDLGKIAVEDYILKKPGRFTRDEYELMKIHAIVGAEIVEKALKGIDNEEFLEIAKNMAQYHHEKWDGTGYPEGLAGNKIPLEARIMALADVFDALVSKRYYKENYSYDEAFRIIEESLGTHFDPELGRVFLKCREELAAYYDTVKE